MTDDFFFLFFLLVKSCMFIFLVDIMFLFPVVKTKDRLMLILFIENVWAHKTV